MLHGNRTCEFVQPSGCKSSKVGFVTASRVQDESSIVHQMQFNPRVCHLPVPVVQVKSGNKCCALCRWATGKKYCGQVSFCEGCKVVLCVWCFKSFHTVPDLAEKRDMIYLETVARKNC